MNKISETNIYIPSPHNRIVIVWSDVCTRIFNKPEQIQNTIEI
jgi:hypothetical protein